MGGHGPCQPPLGSVSARIPLLVVLGEAAIDLVDDESQLQIHDSQAVLSSGEVIVG